MNKQRNIRRTLLAVVLSAFGAGTMAQEIEPNNNINLATPLTVGSTGSVTVNGVIGNAAGLPVVPDIDFYSFQASAGDIVTIDVDGAWRGLKTNSLDSVLTLFGPGPSGPFSLLRESDDPKTTDSGSIGTPGSTSNPFRDARIDNAKLAQTGTYYVAVTTAEVYFLTYSSFKKNLTRSNGPYTLIITGVTPPIVHINIDIKPGSGDTASPINPKSKGNVPVALLGAKDFDPFKIDVNSLRFGSTGDEQSLRRCSNDPEDVNGDGQMDRVCHFDNEAAFANHIATDLEATLKGKTTDGKMFEGNGRLKVVPPAKAD